MTDTPKAVPNGRPAPLETRAGQTPPPKPGLITFEGEGLVCDAGTGVCTIPGQMSDNPKA